MEKTPRANRIHIGLFGRCNSGKSSLMNALAGHEAALVSEVAGTTTDPVATAMEFPGLGAVTLLDTAGFDDTGTLGSARLAQTRKAADRTDIALFIYNGEENIASETEWLALFRERGIPVVVALNKCDLLADPATETARFEAATGLCPIPVSAKTGAGLPALFDALATAGRDAAAEVTITGDLARAGDVVLLVMPQDAAAPKGRLILPQVQTLRELLDKGCVTISCSPETMGRALEALAAPPRLVITDSQVFGPVSRLTPPESLLTSFSVLFANYKGDIRAFIAGAEAIDRLTADSRILIAEACTHAPASEDIGRVKIPRMLRAKCGESLRIDVVAGDDFPQDLTPYDLVIHCGACMFNRRHVLSRIAQAETQGVPTTNYGIAIAHLTGLLGKIACPGGDFPK